MTSSAWRTLMYAMIDDEHPPTGATVHLGEGGELPTAAALMIAQFPDDSGVYLVHLDSTGRELTDTYHDSLGDALAQAETEFRLVRGDWQDGAPELP